ncbi:MAG: hypothetical protein ACJ779_01475 [Chloroflexota bacterium]
MTSSHQLLGWLMVALSGALVAVGAWSVATGRRSGGRADHRFAVDRLFIVVLASVMIAVASGLLLLATDHRPADGLHLLYGVVAVVVLPIGYVVGLRTARPETGRLMRQRDAWAVVAGIFLLGIAVRLFGTG